jgi:hypothetical protein
MKAYGLSALGIVLLLGADAAKQPAIPEVNKKVLQFCEANLGKKVGDGECASLATHALRKAEVKPSSYSIRTADYVWGKLVRTVTAGTNLTGAVLPGDILQFHDATFKGKVGETTVGATFPHHTAIVAAVKNKGKVLEILHQNSGGAGKSDEERRRVQRGTLRFEHLQKGGWVKIYRPGP